jgi:hypothetical protein
MTELSPDLQYLKWINGTGTERGYSVDTDTDGNTYVSGNTSSTTLTIGTETFTRTTTGTTAAYLSKMDTSGNVIWFKWLDTNTGSCLTRSVCALSNTHIYAAIDVITGTTLKINDVTISTASSSDVICILKLSTDGTLVWYKWISGAVAQYYYKMIIDASGSLYVTGFTSGTTVTINNVSYTTPAITSRIAILIKINGDSTGTTGWFKYIVGNGDEAGYSLAVDSNNNILCAIQTTSTSLNVNGTTYSNLVASGRSYTCYTIKFSNSGEVTWIKPINGTLADYPGTIAVDLSNNLLMGFTTDSADFIYNSVTYGNRPTSSGNLAVCILKTNNDGAYINHAWFDGTDDENLHAIEVDNNNNYYIGLRTFSTSITLGGTTYNRSTNTTDDSFFLKLNSNLNTLWVEQLKGTDLVNSSDYNLCVKFDRVTSSLYMHGFTTTNNTVQFKGALYDRPSVGTDGCAYLIKLQNISGLSQYPPSPSSASNTWLVSNSGTSNGIYDVSSSSVYSTNQPYLAFNNTLVQTGWKSNLTYTSATGVYNGSAEFQGISGEWIKAHIPTQVVLRKYVIHSSNTNYTTMSPNTFKLFASNDNTTWTLLDTRTNIGWTSASQPFFIDNTISYRYYTLLVTKVGNSASTSGRTSVEVAELQLFGTEAETDSSFTASSTNYTIITNSSQNCSVLTNDAINTLQYAILTAPVTGTLGTIASNHVLYTAIDVSNNLTENFTYRAFNGTKYSTIGTVTITIATVDASFTATNLTQLMIANSAHTFTLNSANPTANAVTYAILTAPVTGTLGTIASNHVLYTAIDASNNLTENFTYRGYNGVHFSTIGTVTITIATVDVSFTATNLEYLMFTNNTINIVMNTANPTANSVAYSIISAPVTGTLGTINTNTMTYTTDVSNNTTEVCSYRGYNGVHFSTTGIVTIVIKTNLEQLISVANTLTTETNTVFGAALNEPVKNVIVSDIAQIKPNSSVETTTNLYLNILNKYKYNSTVSTVSESTTYQTSIDTVEKKDAIQKAVRKELLANNISKLTINTTQQKQELQSALTEVTQDASQLNKNIEVFIVDPSNVNIQEINITDIDLVATNLYFDISPNQTIKFINGATVVQVAFKYRFFGGARLVKYFENTETFTKYYLNDGIPIGDKTFYIYGFGSIVGGGVAPTIDVASSLDFIVNEFITLNQNAKLASNAPPNPAINIDYALTFQINDLAGLFPVSYQQNSVNTDMYDIDVTMDVNIMESLLNNSTSNWNITKINNSVTTAGLTNSNEISKALLEIIAIRVFGSGNARAAIVNDMSIESEVLSHTNDFINILTNKKDDLFRAYVDSGRIAPGDVNQGVIMDFTNTHISFPMYVTGSILNPTGNVLSIYPYGDGYASYGGYGTMADGEYNIPVIIKFAQDN